MNQPTADLAQLQAGLLAFARRFDDADLRRQPDALLSPLGWHLRHCVFIECLWICEIVGGDDRLTRPLRTDCIPELAPKPTRGARLPPRDALLAWAETEMAANLRRLGRLPAGDTGNRLLDDGYLGDFLADHHAQHLETMAMVATALALARAPDRPRRPGLTANGRAGPDFVTVDGGRIGIGTAHGFAFDNERPARTVDLDAFTIARRPVSNGDYARFIADGGYREPSYWSPAGWHWRRTAGISAPYHWRRAVDGGWVGVGIDGVETLAADEPVSGINRYEAGACARWAGAALPHEYQWEAARRAQAIADHGHAWEWCANDFHPYPGFRPFTYRAYSQSWFDHRHVVLRGASRHTHPRIARPGFRNYYSPHCRHIFAGLRLIADAPSGGAAHNRSGQEP